MEQKQLKRVIERIQMLIRETENELRYEKMSDTTEAWNKGWIAAANQIKNMLEPYVE